MDSTNDNVVAFSTKGSRAANLARHFVPTRLKNARVAKRLNQAELGDAIGKTRQAVSSYELGEKSPEAATLGAIAHVLCQPLAYFTTPDHGGFGEFGTRFFERPAEIRSVVI